MIDYSIYDLRKITEAYEYMGKNRSSYDSIVKEILSKGKLTDVLLMNTDKISYKVECYLESVDRAGSFLKDEVLDWDLRGASLDEITTTNISEAALIFISSENSSFDGMKKEMSYMLSFADTSGFKFKISHEKWTVYINGNKYEGNDSSILISSVLSNIDRLLIPKSMKSEIEDRISNVHVVNSDRGIYINSDLCSRLNDYGKKIGLNVNCECGMFKGSEDKSNEGASDFISFKSYRNLMLLIGKIGELFRDIPPNLKSIDYSADDFMSNCLKIADKEMMTEWYHEDFTPDEGMIRLLMEPIAEKSREGLVNNCGRFVTSQSDSISFPLSRTAYNDMSMLNGYIKEGYHCGNHWSMDGYGFYDAGDYDKSYSTMLFNGDIPLYSINIEKTIAARYRFTEEKEIYVMSGRPIFNPRIYYCTNQIELYISPIGEKCLIS